MNCKACNTRMGEGVRFCPNCGNDAGAAAKEPRPKAGRMPRLPVRPRKVEDPELSLEEPADPSDLSGSGRADVPPPRRTAPRPSAATGAAQLVPEPAAVRDMLASRPDLLESGLRVHADAQGKPVGVDFSTDVGEIDLLARDGAGNFVVVMVAERGQGEEGIAEVLQRIGWVRKHLASGSERVRGTLLLDETPDGLGYSAAAVADTIAFRTYKMTLCFEDLKI
jgi:hypothetical protein